MRRTTQSGGLPRPTEAELEILSVLWDKGPSTVRDVHEIMSKKGATGYTTALKLLQVMHRKGLVERDDSERAHVYMPVLSKDATQTQFVADLVQRVFDGSASQLALHALGNSAKASPEELRKIRELIASLEKGRK